MSDLRDDAALQPASPESVLTTPTVGMQSPGAILAAVRQQNGLTIEQVASQLNLAPRQVAALEADDHGALPGMVIVRGFLRAYAKLLKIDPVPLLAMLGDMPTGATSAPTRQVMPSSFAQAKMPNLHGGQSRSAKTPVAAVLAVAVVALGASYVLGWWPDALTRRLGQLRGTVTAGFSNGSAATGDANVSSEANRAADAGSSVGSATGVGSSGDNSAAAAADSSAATRAGETGLTSSMTLANPVADSASSSTAPAAASGAATNAATAPAVVAPVVVPPSLSPGKPAATSMQGASAASATGPNPLVLNVQQDSWIEIRRANNTAIVSRLVKAGSVETFDIDQPVTLVVGNIAGVEASLRGAPLSLESGAKGNVSKLRIE